MRNNTKKKIGGDCADNRRRGWRRIYPARKVTGITGDE
jgi:hypothetical protein